jgi:MPBQ/MSBQ methyltransferase
MCTEWSHPYFISIQDFEGLAKGTNVMENVRSEDWAKFTIPSWRHSVWVGVFDPFFWMLRPHLWYVDSIFISLPRFSPLYSPTHLPTYLPYRIKILRDAFTLNVFHNAFKDGLMGYGMIYAQKKQ